MYIPIVIYVPALAFAQVTGISLQVLIPMVCVVCIFYTTLVSNGIAVEYKVTNDVILTFTGRAQSRRLDGHSSDDADPHRGLHCLHPGHNRRRRTLGGLAEEPRWR